MAFYDELQQMTRELLMPDDQGGLGQGAIELVRITEGTPDPNQPWIPVEPQVQSQPLKGVAKGVRASLVGTEMGGTVIIASDREVLCEVPVGDYSVTDTIKIDGVSCQIITVQKIPEAGTTVAVRFIVRG